jgi:hypothetical protein
MEMASKAIVSTFKLITLCVKYCKQCINANDFARIICMEYGMPEIEEFNRSCLVNVLHHDRQFKFANISFQGGNVSGVFHHGNTHQGVPVDDSMPTMSQMKAMDHKMNHQHDIATLSKWVVCVLHTTL